MNSYLISLTDRDKKILAVLAVIFVLVFIIIGALYQLMRARMKKKGEKIYEYLYELNKYKVIIQVSILCIAVVMIIIGITNGGAEDVLQKAINICTECIGLG